MKNDLYFLVKSGPIKKDVEAFRKAYLAYNNRKWKLVRELGGKQAGCFNGFRGSLYALALPEGVLPVNSDQWNKPKKGGAITPRKGSEAARKFKELGDAPLPKDFLKSMNWPSHYTYTTGKGSRGSCLIGGFFGPEICWYDSKGPIIIAVGDIGKATKNRRKEHNEYNPKQKLKFTSPVNPKIPSGLKVILPEQWAFMVAKNDVKKKKAKAV